MHQFVTITSGGERGEAVDPQGDLRDRRRAGRGRRGRRVPLLHGQRKAEGHLDFDLDLAKDATGARTPPTTSSTPTRAPTGSSGRRAEAGAATPAARASTRGVSSSPKRSSWEEAGASRISWRARREPRAAPRRLLPARSGRALESLHPGRQAPPRGLRGRRGARPRDSGSSPRDAQTSARQWTRLLGMTARRSRCSGQTHGRRRARRGRA